jgi:hypothetical protein
MTEPPPATSAENRFKSLPERIPPEEMVEEVEAEPTRDLDPRPSNPDRGWFESGG